jgi:endonuclease-3
LSQRRPKVALSRGRGAPAGLKTRGARRPKNKKIAAVPGRSVTDIARRKPAKGAARTRGRRRIPDDQLPQHAAEVYRRLLALYPDAHCELDYASAWQLLIATILSAQCTDRRVNMVTPILFAKYPTPAMLAAAPTDDVEHIIKSTGFFRNKTKSILGMANALVARHQDTVPKTMEELVTLPGVGRKTANVVLGNAFHVNEGIVVDTHVQRVTTRLGLSTETDPAKIERALMPLFRRDQWTMLAHLLIWHGRRICDAKRPRCELCTLNDICPSSSV